MDGGPPPSGSVELQPQTSFEHDLRSILYYDIYWMLSRTVLPLRAQRHTRHVGAMSPTFDQTQEYFQLLKVLIYTDMSCTF